MALPVADDRAQGLKHLAALHGEYERFHEARTMLDAAIVEAPKDLHLVFARAEASLSLDEPQAALADAERVVRERPGWFDGMNLCAKVYACLGDWRAAIPLWEACHAQQPMNPHIVRDLERARVEIPPEAVAGGSDGGGKRQDRDAAGNGAGAASAPQHFSDSRVTEQADDDGAARELSEVERKATALKDLANESMEVCDHWRANQLLTEAIEMAPHMAVLWSNRSRGYEATHKYEEALADAQEAIALAPEWPRGYLRAGRALLSLERYTEAQMALRLALELDPKSKVVRDALDQSNWLVKCRDREEASMTSKRPNKDLIGIRRGACRKKGCGCECYVQKQGSHAVMVRGRYVRHDNNPTFFRCLRCEHEAYMHADTRVIYDPRPGPQSQRRQQEELKAQQELEAKQHQPGQGVPIPHTNQGEGARGGLDSSYYYAAVGPPLRPLSHASRHTHLDATPQTHPFQKPSGGSLMRCRDSCRQVRRSEMSPLPHRCASTPTRLAVGPATATRRPPHPRPLCSPLFPLLFTSPPPADFKSWLSSARRQRRAARRTPPPAHRL